MPKKLNYDTMDIEERLKSVNEVLSENPEPSEAYLEKMADYLIKPLDKEEKLKQKRTIISSNRKSTINFHEVSYEGLAASLESGEDGIYNLIGDKRRATVFRPKKEITKKDIDEIPPLAQLREDIRFWQEKYIKAVGTNKWIIHGFIKDMQQYQYIIKDSWNPPIAFSNITPSKHICDLYEKVWVDKDGNLKIEGTSLCDKRVCTAILCNYSTVKQEGYDNFEGDLYYLITSFDYYCAQALKNHPILEQIVIDKIDGLQNADIQLHLEEMFGMSYSTEYISNLYRNKIPKLIASAAEDDYISNWFIYHEKGNYKKCSRCGKIKIAIPKYFSKNSASNDGFYSICKECRNKTDKKD